MGLESKYIKIKHANKTYLIQSIRCMNDIIIVIMYPKVNELNGLSLSCKTVEALPSTTQIYGDVLDSESQSISQLLSLKLNKRVTVSCNVDLDSYNNSKVQLTTEIIKALQNESL
ncbi:Proteasome assembly chaperone 3 [Entamoeba marina]